MKMQKIDTEKVRKALTEIMTIILDEGLAEALQSVGQDKTLLANAKANPKAFLKAQGFTVPTKTEAKMTVKKSGRKLPTSEDIVPRLIIRICFTYFSSTIFPNHPLENKINLTTCRDYLIW